MFPSPLPLLDELAGLLDRLGALDWRDHDPDVVAASAVALVRGADRLEAISLLAVAEHDRRGGVTRDGDGSLGDWTSRQTKSSKDTGRRRAAKAKRVAKAPEVAKAAADGRLSSEQADRLAAARTEQNAELFDQRADELITRAQGSLEDAVTTAEEFRRQTGETPADRAERLWARRSAACWDDDEGMIQGRQQLTGDGGSTFKAAFDAFVEREGRAADDRRTWAQRRADAAVELARFALAALRGEKPGLAERATVKVLVRYEDLLDDPAGTWNGEDETTGLPLSGQEIRRLCCDADIIRLVTRGDSLVIDVGRKTRAIPTALRRAVLARDGHRCTYPGCHLRDGLQVHHARHWANLGPTDIANLLTTCWRHHRLVHEGGWAAEIDPATQRTIWTSPDGRRLIGQRRATAGAPGTAA